MQYHVLYNPLAGNGKGESAARALADAHPADSFTFEDVTAITDFAAFFAALPADRKVVIAGGDGTLNRFINDTADVTLPEEVYYYATGSGNDFLNDLEKKPGGKPILLTPYLKSLPRVFVNGMERRFINGIGYGIDGYCCEEGDRLRATSDKPINYTSIAIKGLLFHYHPTNATVIADGKEYTFKKVWLAPTMNGRYYGGGMIPTPAQDRLSPAKTVSTMVMFGSGKIKTLMVFPSIFKGEHVQHTEMCRVLTGHDITVQFDRPTALQIDGETVTGVTEYRVLAGE